MLPTILTELSVSDMRTITGGKADDYVEAATGLPTLPPVKFDSIPDLTKEMTAPQEEEEKKKKKGQG
ncbi:hypothetical protein [Chitinophaga barathri]|uniref:Uncharacterized protein n=1 Tax=Chitinophaga barathri TaxID=1647451 RepID=A0A3N4MJX3_9BACT|nr:hypothetical protein [Chitinophaga barathri]RPD40400.1 hypothetical protein EG028_13920 [Chitinophaga barathri]